MLKSVLKLLIILKALITIYNFLILGMFSFYPSGYDFPINPLHGAKNDFQVAGRPWGMDVLRMQGSDCQKL